MAMRFCVEWYVGFWFISLSFDWYSFPLCVCVCFAFRCTRTYVCVYVRRRPETFLFSLQLPFSRLFTVVMVSSNLMLALEDAEASRLVYECRICRKKALVGEQDVSGFCVYTNNLDRGQSSV